MDELVKKFKIEDLIDEFGPDVQDTLQKFAFEKKVNQPKDIKTSNVSQHLR